MLRREPDGSLVQHADLSGLSEHAWNEIAVDGRGNAYVNNIGFDMAGGEFAPGIVAVVTPDGSARQVADGVAFPNGMAITPDGSTLIVAESYAARLTAFDIEADGALSNRRSWAELGEGAAPDGICLDAEGAVWYGDVPNRHCRRVARGRRGARDDRARPRLLRLRARRRGRPDAVHGRPRVGGDGELRERRADGSDRDRAGSAAPRP